MIATKLDMAGVSEARTCPYGVRAGSECAAGGPGLLLVRRGAKGDELEDDNNARNPELPKEQQVAAATDAAHYHPLTTATDWRRHCICLLAQDGGGPGPGRV